MLRSARPLRRVLLVPAALLCLILATGAPAAASGYTSPPEYQTGQIGHYDFRDYSVGSHDGNVSCDYHLYSSGLYRVEDFLLRAPRIWWYDNDADTTQEHGTVGWQYRVQESSDPDTVPFSTVYTSSVQKHTAHEDHPGYSDGDKAPFTNRTLQWSSGHNVDYRIKYTITWYKSDGTAQGTLSHWYDVYHLSVGGDYMGYCINKTFAF